MYPFFKFSKSFPVMAEFLNYFVLLLLLCFCFFRHYPISCSSTNFLIFLKGQCHLQTANCHELLQFNIYISQEPPKAWLIGSWVLHWKLLDFECNIKLTESPCSILLLLFFKGVTSVGKGLLKCC